MRYVLYALMGIGLIFPHKSYARPVSYPTGWTGMTMNNGEMNSLHIHYSPTAKTSIGYKFEHWRDGQYNINAIQMNNLIKRWNNPDSQGNLYLKSAIGNAHNTKSQSSDKDDLAAFTGIAADWENRSYFASYENRYTDAGDIDDVFTQSARVGWAPYEGDYGDLHTWLMVQVDHTPENQDPITVTPMVRLFKDVHLVEAGMNNRGAVMFNYIIRY